MMLLSRMTLAGLLALVGLIPSCKHTDGGAKGDGLSSQEIGRIRQQMVAYPVPENPQYYRTRQACFFFVEHPDDASMVPVGMLKNKAFVIVRKLDGDWTDVQLTSGQLGSVMSVNLRKLTSDEGAVREYLQPQPDLDPLPLPQ